MTIPDSPRNPVTRRTSRLAADGLERLRAIAAAHGGQLLDDRYLGIQVRYRFRCRQGHEWRATGNAIFSRHSWCRLCRNEENSLASRDPEGLARLQAAAAAKGGVCLSQSYTNQAAHYRFRCGQGHEWETLGHSVLGGTWCRRCNEKEKSRESLDPEGLARLQAAAAAKGGVCLSEAYTGINGRYRFRCAQGHEWETDGRRVIRGLVWCLHCSRDPEGRIAICHEIAAQRGGQCLSQVYHNSTTKLTWMCDKGHIWDALASNIKRGTWCPQCVRINKITRGFENSRGL